MSKSSKSDKYNCLANCLPMKGCLQRSKRRPSIPPGVASVVYNLTDGSGKMESTFGQQDAKSALTKQWLHNVSTVANFDHPSCADDSNLDCTLSDSLPTKENRRLGYKACRSASGCPCHRDSGACNNNRQDERERQRHHEERRHLGNGGNNGNEGGAQAGMNDSCRSERCCEYCDTSSSSSYNDSSHLSSNCCSVQKKEVRRRRTFDNGANSTPSSTTDENGSRRAAYERYRNRLDNTAESTSVCSSTLSLSAQSVILDMDACPSLGITVIGHSNNTGDTGIYIGCIKKTGAVARCGRIEPGDLILDVNGIELERMKNEDALATLKREVAKGGRVHVVVGKYWNMEGEGPVKDSNAQHMESLYETVGSVRNLSISTSKRPGSSSSDGAASSEVHYAEAPQGKTGNVLRAIPEDNGGGASARQFREATGMSSADLERLFDLSKAARKFGFGAKQPQPPFQHGSFSSHGSSGSSSSRGVTPYRDSGYQDTRCGVTSAGSCHSLHQQSMVTDDRRLRPAAMMGAGSNGGGLATVGRGSSGGGDNARGGSNVSDVPTSSFCGVELVNWIQTQVVGLRGRMDAVSYAQNLLKTEYICNVDPRQGDAFQESFYYAFGRVLQGSTSGAPLQSKML